MTPADEIKAQLVALKDIATAGYALALHIKFTTPTFLFQSYQKEWLDYYSQNGLVMSDPTVHWGFENNGLMDWAALRQNDVAGVMSKAAEHGLTHGVTCACERQDSRSIGSFSRSDRPFSPDESKALEAALHQLHDLTANLAAFDPEVAEELHNLSIMFTHPAGGA